MSSITFHSSPGPGGRPGGKPRTGRLSSRDPVVAARLARSIAMKGEWRTLPHRDDKQKILAAIGATARWAVRALSPDVVSVLPAIGKEKPPGGCDWCAALVERLPEPELDHRDPVNLAALGNPCASCRRRWANAEATATAAEAEAGYLSDLTADGARVASAVRGLERARRTLTGRAPTPAGPTVRDQIRLARERQRAREATYPRVDRFGWY